MQQKLCTDKYRFLLDTPPFFFLPLRCFLHVIWICSKSNITIFVIYFKKNYSFTTYELYIQLGI